MFWIGAFRQDTEALLQRPGQQNLSAALSQIVSDRLDDWIVEKWVRIPVHGRTEGAVGLDVNVVASAEADKFGLGKVGVNFDLEKNRFLKCFCLRLK